MSSIISIIFVFCLIAMNGFFVATEFSMVRARKSRMETLALNGSKSAKRVLRVLNNLNSYLSACQLGVTLSSLGLGWVGEPAVSALLVPLFKAIGLGDKMIHSMSVLIGFSTITAFEIVLGELVPKSLAIASTEKIAMATAFPLLMVYKITYPIMWCFNHTTGLFLKLFGLSMKDDNEIAHTDQEIKLLVEVSYKHGLIDKTELTFVDNIFDFSETTASDIMIPRTDMACVFTDDNVEDIVDFMVKGQYTRYPLCSDSKDNVVGFIHIKDLYRLRSDNENVDLNSVKRTIDYVPECLSISKLLRLFKSKKVQMAIVVDEYGGTAGLVTLEDVLEEIVGDIQDEFDEEPESVVKSSNGDITVDGKITLDDVNDMIDFNIEDDNIDTIGGWVYSRLSGYPKVNDKITYKEHEFIVLKCDNKRVTRVMIKKVQSKNECSKVAG